jgi:drug/metabolite transporter (DMT)-like permease
MAMTPAETGPRRWQLVLAFASVYLIWGSTYLAIKFAIETIPPFFMAGVRFLISGTILYLWARSRGAPRPSRIHWKSAAVVGTLLLLGGNGGVVWAEQRVASGVAALIVAIVPVWIALMEWKSPGGRKPGWQVTAGLTAGTLGLVLLASPGEAALGESVDLVGAAVLVFATLCWAAGSIRAKHSPLPDSPLLATGMEMLGGGAALMLAGLVSGEAGQLNFAAMSEKSLLSLLYLTTFGSLIGFTAYIWLLKVGSPTRAATYAYVNPVVAVFLGWLLAGEAMTPRTILATLVIVGGVVLTLSAKTRVTTGERDAPANRKSAPDAAPGMGSSSVARHRPEGGDSRDLREGSTVETGTPTA